MNAPKVQMRKAIARTVVLAAATGSTALALASPASAEKFDKSLAVNCPQPYSQTCSPRPGQTVYTAGPLFVQFVADNPPRACAAIRARVFVDGNEWGSAIVQPGGSDSGYFIPATPGAHHISIQADGIEGGCNTGSMSGWAGNLHIETNQDAENGAS